jgi:hypothetical protein
LLVREQQRKLSALEMELAAARQEGFDSKYSTETTGTNSKKRPLVVIGILSGFGRKNNRDAIRKAWMGTGISFFSVGLMFFVLVYHSFCLSQMCLISSYI